MSLSLARPSWGVWRRPRSGRAAFAAAALVLAVAGLSGCGGSGETPATGAAPTAMQVMATVERGDLTQTAMGMATVETVAGKKVVVATIDAQNASGVSAGQSATVFFGRDGGSGFPQPGQSGAPMPPNGQSGAPLPPGGQSGAPVPQDGQGGFGGPGGPGGDRGGTAGAVSAVTVNADGTASATIAVDELPAGVADGSRGFARIAVKVLAADVLLVPTAAVEGSGDSATVEVSAGGKTETRSVTLGQQAGGMTEVVSGLNEGENVVYTQAFRGFQGGGQSGAPFPQGGAPSGAPLPQGDGQSGGIY